LSPVYATILITVFVPLCRWIDELLLNQDRITIGSLIQKLVGFRKHAYSSHLENIGLKPRS